MNYSKLATLGIRFVALYYFLYGAYDCMEALSRMQTERGFDIRPQIAYICFRFFVGLLLNRLSLPLGRLMAKGLGQDEMDKKTPE